MSSRATVSVLFLLVAFVSLVARSTAYVQELHIDNENTDDDNDDDDSSISSSSRHDVDAVWPPPPPHLEPARQRRMPNPPDRGAIIDTLNRLRRSHGAPDMYYVVRCVFIFSVKF